MTAQRILEDPAEGSREIVERELGRQARSGMEVAQSATWQDVKRVLGEMSDIKIADVLALRPTVPELEEAGMWSRGEGDIIGREGHRLSGKAAMIFEIISAEEDEPGDEDGL